MTPFRAGDLVAVDFPFSDLQTRKRRPGLVLVARLTTHPPREPSDVAMKRWSEIGLPRASTIRLTKLVTIDHRLVHHKIGQLHLDDARTVVQAVQEMAKTVANELLK
jgi:mRNA interferase MazF